MNVPQNLLYTKDHEWVRVEATRATFGITAHAQEALGDITYVELPKRGAAVRQGAHCATIESVKAASDVYAPLSGVTIAVNEALVATPEVINQSPYEHGWFAVIDIENTAELAALLSAEEYQTLLTRTTA